jgi:hypothetical protein
MRVWIRDKDKNEQEYATATRVVEGKDKVRVFGEDDEGREVILAMVETNQIEKLMTIEDVS